MAAKVLVIDGQGGGLGRQLVSALAAACPEAELTAVGTNLSLIHISEPTRP